MDIPLRMARWERDREARPVDPGQLISQHRNASTRTYMLDYQASTAQWHAERRARKPETATMVTHHQLRPYVQDKLSGEIIS